MVNVCVVGPNKSGKSAIVLRLMYNIFPLEHDPTIDDWYTKMFHGLRLQFRDTSGLMTQPEKGLRLSSLNDSHIVLLVYDASDPKSVSDLSLFAQEVNIMEGKQQVFVVANKCDKVDETHADTIEEGMGMARENGWQHISVSAKTTAHLNYLFDMISQTPIGDEVVEPIKESGCCHIL